MATSAPSPRATLAAFANNRVDDATLWRRLMTYDDWLVSLPELVSHYQLLESTPDNEYAARKNVYQFDAELVTYPEQLWLFTDAESAQRVHADGKPLGLYADGYAGTEVFGKLQADWHAILINGIPDEESFVIPRESFSTLESWVDSFRLEREFANLADVDPARPPSPDHLAHVFSRLEQFPHFELPVFESSGTLLAVNDGQSGVDEVVICTWPDCTEAVKALVPAETRADVKKMILDGASIFHGALEQGYQVVTINPCGPGAGVRIKLGDETCPNQFLNAWPPMDPV